MSVVRAAARYLLLRKTSPPAFSFSTTRAFARRLHFASFISIIFDASSFLRFRVHA
jgi:hypothetical protein